MRALAKRLVKTRSTRIALRSLISAVQEAGSSLGRMVKRADKIVVPSGEVQLNLGCGDKIASGWINLDLTPQSSEARYFNALDGLPIDSEVVHRIHCEHFLEHLNYDDAREFLSECFRVLVVGGSIRIILPDAEKYLTAYVRSDLDFFEKLKDLGGASFPMETPIQIINQMFRMGDAHKFAWDFATLKLELAKCGFRSIEKSCLGDVLPQYDIDGRDWWRPYESLYVNAAKL